MTLRINNPSTRQIGQSYEKVAEDFLVKNDLTLIERNFHSKTGEIDLIMQDQTNLVFVEVRFRRSTDFGGSEASVSVLKQKHLIRAAQYYLQRRYGNRPPICRFDVVAISGLNINWIKNAFYAF